MLTRGLLEIPALIILAAILRHLFRVTLLLTGLMVLQARSTWNRIFCSPAGASSAELSFDWAVQSSCCVNRDLRKLAGNRFSSTIFD